MALWIVIALLAVTLWASRERIFTYLTTHPLRHPHEAARRAEWNGIFERAGCVLRHGGLIRVEAGGRPWWDFIEDADTARDGSGSRGAPPEMALWMASPRSGRDTPGAPLVLLIHGYSHSSLSVCPPALAAVRLGMGIVLADLPGHGLSAPALCAYGQREVDAIRALIGQLAQRRQATYGIVVVGFSMGASLVALAMESMSLEERAVLSGIVLGAPYWALRETMNRYAVNYLGLRDRALLMRAVARAESAARFQVDQWDPSLRFVGMKERYGSPWPPALLLRGTRDVLVSGADADAWQAAWPGPIELAELPEVDHDGLWRHEVTIDTVTDWLAKVPVGVRVGARR